MSSPDGATPLLTNTQIKLISGHKYGLVGKNGSGKTTLLKAMATYQMEGFPVHIRMAYVKQEHEHDDYTVMEAVLKSDVIRTQLLQKEEELQEKQYTVEDDEELEAIELELSEITDFMEKVDLRGSIQRAAKILMGLGFTTQMQKMKTRDCSGGWRMRVELAKALFIQPDLLLLDEPTNHLDFPAVLWLQDYLKNDFKNTLVIVSHDRTFLNEIMTHTIFLNDLLLRLDCYKGNYDQFEKSRDEEARAVQHAYDAQQHQIRQIEEFIEKFKDKGEKRAAQVQSKAKVLEKLKTELIEPPTERKTFRFKFPEPDEIDQAIVQLEDVKFGYKPEKLVLENINLTVHMDSRIGVIGANGVGKSTLIKLMLGLLEPTDGLVERNRHARIAYFTQHHYDQLDLTTSAVEYFLKKFQPELEDTPDRVQFVRRHLGRFGISGDRQNQRMKLLSGGQKSRVAFAVLTFKTPHFIIMDEPTNHLDLETVEALIDALKAYEGGVLAISHDQHFLSNVGDVFWSVTPEKIRRFRSFENAKKFALQKRIEEVHYA
eukprot:334754_1